MNAGDRMVWEYDGRFYVVTESSVTWAAAQSQAEALGGHLVTIRNGGHQAWLSETFGRFGSLWIGLTDEVEEGEWVWASGEQVNYTNWADGQPFSSSSYNWAYMEDDGQWYNWATSSTTLRGVIELSGPDSDGDGIPDVLDAYPDDPWNNFDLREAGPDGVFDTEDDRVYRLTLDPAYAWGTTVGLFIEQGPLPDGYYRFTANATLTDRAGHPLDGSGDGVGGDVYQQTFYVGIPPEYTLESGNNDTRATATALPLTEDPGGSGYFVGRGLGSIYPADDQDWWSFEALVGDLVSVSVDTPESSLDPSVVLYDAAGSWLASDSWSGPGNDAFISRYAIVGSGTYYVQVNSQWSTTGAYELRLDLARGIDLESDAGYANDSVEGANVLQMSPVGAGRAATVAGSIMAPTDVDYFNLGQVAAGESIIVSLRLPDSSSLVRPIVEIRDAQGNPLEVVVSPIETAARAHITQPGTYYAAVRTMAGGGPRGQYLMNAAVWPTGTLDFPDLLVSHITAPTEAANGETISVSWTVKNEGTGSTYHTSWYDRIVLSANDRYGDADDIELARVRYEGVLEPDEQYTVQAGVQVPVGSEGVYYVFVATDADDRVYEYIFEDNNVGRADLPIAVELTPYADLEVGDVSAPEELFGTDPVTITWEVTNRGEGTTGDGTPGGTVSEWIDRIVFSRNTTFGDGDDRLVAEVPRSGELGPGQSYSGTWTGMLPGALSGEYYVFVATDAAGDVYEHDDAYSNVARTDEPTRVRQWIIEPGPLAEDTVWDGLIQVLGTVTIPAGRTLTIEPGAIVKFHTGGLDVYGKLEVRGTAEEPVILTSIRDDTAGGDTNDDGDATSPAPGDWTGLIVHGTGHADLEYFEIRYATTAINADYEGALVDLTNGIIRDSSQFGIYTYQPYVEITGANLLIADNGYSGVYVQSDARLAFRNCTIVGNGFTGYDWDWRSSGIFLALADLTIVNTIVAFNRNGLYHYGWAGAPNLVIRNSLFHNPSGDEIVTYGGIHLHGVDETVLQAYGNIVADPLFVDRAAGNYELGAFSPAIDAGRAIAAPPLDILGRPRFDDLGQENRGSGNPSYVDIGAYERQVSSLPYADLALVSVSASPLDIGSGDTITITWTVENTGQRDLTDGWIDAIYLSSDPHLSTATDRLLAEIPRTESIPVGARYTQTWTGAIPADLAGPQYVIVRTNSGRAFRESTSVNNTRTFDQVVAVAIPTLTTDAPQTGHVARGEWAYYRFDAEPGRSVLFELDSAVSSGAVYLYLRRGAVPTVSNYHVAATTFNRPDQQLRLLEPSAGVYYIGVYGQSLGAGGTNFTLTAQPTDLAIRRVTPGTVGNAGPVTVEIVGDNFSRGALVTLLGPDGVSVIEGEPWFQDASTLYATFDLAVAGAAPGVYDVVVAVPDVASVTKFDALSVQAGGAAALATNLTVPGLARPGREIQVTVRYTNTGTIDLPSPLLTLESSEVMAWRRVEPEPQPVGGPTAWARAAVVDTSMIRPWLIDPRWFERVSVTFLGLSATGPAAVIRPGQTETLTLSVRTPFAAGRVPFTLYAFGKPGDPELNDTLDWAQLSADLRPTDLPDDAWNPLLARLQAQIGTTWGDYLDVLRDNANHLAEIGQRVYDHGDLFSFEFVQAVMMGTPAYMDAVQDAFAPASGLPLSFERHFLPEPLRRARLGPLGRGWMHTYQITLYERSDGSVAIHGPSTGFDRSFQPDGSGGYLAAGNATLTPLADGEFLLTEASGLEYLFRSDGRWAWIEEPNGNRLTASYDAQGRLVRVTHSGGDRFLFEYNAAGRLVKLIDHADRATHYTYDASGEHLLSVTGPDGEPTTYTYLTGAGPLLDHHLTSITRPGGVQVQFSYLCPCQLATGEKFRKSQFLAACRVSAPPFGVDDGTAACLTGR